MPMDKEDYWAACLMPKPARRILMSKCDCPDCGLRRVRRLVETFSSQIAGLSHPTIQDLQDAGETLDRAAGALERLIEQMYFDRDTKERAE